jgi:nitroreductase
MGVIVMELMLGSGCTPFDASAPTAAFPEKCIRCGHCVAACPSEALDHDAAPLSAQIPFEYSGIIDPETAIKFLRARRSVRAYREELVPTDTLARLLDIARFAPSGTNTQGLSYIVVSDKERLNPALKAVVDWLLEKLEKPGSRMPKAFWEPVEAYRRGKDALMRGAPHLIVALSPPEILTVSADSAKFALEYVELLATTMGLGTCHMGVMQLCAARKYPPLMEALGIEEGKEVVGLMTVGYPKYRYRRLVDRDPLDVKWL